MESMPTPYPVLFYDKSASTHAEYDPVQGSDPPMALTPSPTPRHPEIKF